MATSQEGELHERPTSELVKELSEQVSSLVRQEVELAKAEMTEKGRKAGLGAGMLGGAAVAALAAVGALTAFLVLILDLALPAWAAALIVTAMWGAVAALLALRGREKVREVGKPVPEKAADSVKEDVKWLKGRTRSESR